MGGIGFNSNYVGKQGLISSEVCQSSKSILVGSWQASQTGVKVTARDPDVTAQSLRQPSIGSMGIEKLDPSENYAFVAGTDSAPEQFRPISVSINASDEMNRELSAEALGQTQVNQEDSPREPLETGVRTSSQRPGSMRQSPDKPAGKQGSLKLLKLIKAAAVVLSDPVLWGIGLAKVTHPFMFSIAKDSSGDYTLFLKKDLRAHPDQARHFTFSGASNDYFHLFRKEAGMLHAKDLYDVGVNMMGKQVINRLLANVYSESVKQRLLESVDSSSVYMSTGVVLESGFPEKEKATCLLNAIRRTSEDVFQALKHGGLVDACPQGNELGTLASLSEGEMVDGLKKIDIPTRFVKHLATECKKMIPNETEQNDFIDLVFSEVGADVNNFNARYRREIAVFLKNIPTQTAEQVKRIDRHVLADHKKTVPEIGRDELGFHCIDHHRISAAAELGLPIEVRISSESGHVR